MLVVSSLQEAVELEEISGIFLRILSTKNPISAQKHYSIRVCSA